MKYRKKPVEIEAVQWNGDNIAEVKELCKEAKVIATPVYFNDPFTCDLLIDTLEGTMRATKGDYIICGVKGELYPCKPDIFRDTYELVT